ncbi:haloacid dehalogenase type II [Neorhizobium sp. P12A]|nr:haloacid dehalogenase type II [Neorhizobium sp. P12A]
MTIIAIAAARPSILWAAPRSALSGVKGLTFDMQGTVFDFYDPMQKMAESVGRKNDLHSGWAASLPGDWSGAAHDIIVDISAGRRQWMSNSDVYRESLEPLLKARGVDGDLSSEDRARLMSVWGEMAPWPDVLPGLTRLRRRYTLSTLTNASMAQMTALVKAARLPFDEIVTGELNHAFKPDPKVYQLAVDYVGFRPDQLLMVSAHKWDLAASKKAGFRTAYVPRPLELGPGHIADSKPEDFIDVMAKDFVELAEKIS